MAIECAGCKKKVSDDNAYCIYECRKDHVYNCCSVICLRVLEKKCAKVADSFRKLQQKLNNEGQAPALRRVQATERDKLKQYLEADKADQMICPKDCTAGQASSVPYCSHLMLCTKNPPPDEDKKVDDDALLSKAPDKSRMSMEVLADDMLMELKKSDDDLIEADEKKTTKSKKTQKGLSKKGQKLILDFKTPHINADVAPGMDTTPVASSMAPYGGGNAWLTGAKDLASTLSTPAQVPQPAPQLVPQKAAQQQRPPLLHNLSPQEKEQKMRTLMATTDCTKQKAQGLLDMTGWNLNAAAEAYFKQEQQSTEPRWGLATGAAVVPQQQQQQQRQQQQQAQAQAVASQPASQPSSTPEETQILTAPSQPPPPPLPPNWQALWCEAEDAYYFWHKPTNVTTWDAPEEEDTAENNIGGGAVASTSAAVREDTQAEQEERLVQKFTDITSAGDGVARELLQQTSWSLEKAIFAYNEQEQERKAEEQRRAIEEATRRAKAEQARAEADASARAAEKERQMLERLGQRFCSRNWKPLSQPEIQDRCLRLFHGECVEVTWTDEVDEGWAYGHALDNQLKEGYFPQMILAPLIRRARQHTVGERCSLSQPFHAPPDIGGYLVVEPGDPLKVLHPLEPPFMWAYVARLGKDEVTTVEAGWVPECILCDPSELLGLGGPQPAG